MAPLRRWRLVCLDGCNVWVHAGCDNISNKRFMELKNSNYYFPDCRDQHEPAQTILEELNSAFKMYN